jgi:hypothetical protein
MKKIRGGFMTDLRRQGLYQDKKGRFLHYRKSSNSCMIIPAHDIKQWQLLRMRSIIAFMIGILAYRLIPTTWYLALIIGLAIYTLLEIFYYRLTKNYTILPNYQPNDLYDPIKANQESKGKLLLKSGLYLVIGILLIVTTFNPTTDTLSNLLIYGVASAAFYFAYLSYNMANNK